MKIAILTSTRPLRERSMEMGREVEQFSPKKCAALAVEYDLVIIGSRASDDFFDRIRTSLTRKTLDKLRLYPRSFFDRFKRTGALAGAVDDRDEGWKEILKSNGISFRASANVVTGEFKSKELVFRWARMEDFLTDDRVTVVK